MATKLIAARLATSAGVTTIITRSSTPSNIFHIVKYIQSLTPSDKTPRGDGTASPNVPPISTEDPVATSNLMSATKLQTPQPGTPTSSTTGALPKHLPCPLHTRFLPQQRAIRDRHFWILHGLKPHGTVYIDQGSFRALTRADKAGLLPVGVIGVEGHFAQQEAVSIVVARKRKAGEEGEDPLVSLGSEVGRALVNYSAGEISRIMGRQSSEIEKQLGYAGEWRPLYACGRGYMRLSY